ncbi:MAG: hypothetical protein J6I84_04555 [Bacilli bacterium]|nr:hypothetical protein [Bacilli bacterium]
MDIKTELTKLKGNQEEAICFWGFNDGYKRAQRLYLLWDTKLNLYRRFMRMEPLLKKLVALGENTWEELEEALESTPGNKVEEYCALRLIHFDYPATGMDTDHGIQICGFDSLEEMLKDIESVGFCFLANPENVDHDKSEVIKKSYALKDAEFFGHDIREFKFLFEQGDDIEEKCASYIPPTPKKRLDKEYRRLKEILKLQEQILRLDPNHEPTKTEIEDTQKKLSEYDSIY